MAYAQSGGRISRVQKPDPGLPDPPIPAPPAQAPAKARRWDSWSTPARLWLGLLGSVLTLLLLTTTAALTIEGESSSARQTSGVVEARAVNVQDLSYSLADADAAAATGILDSPAPAARFTQRYQSDITEADAALAECSVDVAGDPAAEAQLALIDEQFSQYTGLIGTAQADNRIGYPVGGAYLREASTLLERTMLPEVDSVLTAELSARSTSAADSGNQLLWPLLTGLLALVVCGWTWRLLAASTRRKINLGLAAGLLIAVALLTWTVVASVGANSRMTAANTDFQYVTAAQKARGDVAQISADEASSVVSQGADAGAAAAAGIKAATDLTANLAAATDNGSAATGDTQGPAAYANDTALNKKVDGDLTAIQQDETAGDYTDATTAMVGGQTAGGALVDMNALAAALTGSEQSAQSDYQADSSAAANAYTGGPWPVALLGLLAAVAVAFGINRRIAEYR
jgi:hypothetical protein